MKFRIAVPLALGALAVWGCPGPGTTVAGNPSLTDALQSTYFRIGGCPRTTANGSAGLNLIWGSSPATASAVVQIRTGDGGVARSESINRSGLAQGGLTMNGITAGVYEMRVRLFSQPNAGGTELGVTSAPIDLCATTGDAVSRSIQAQFVSTPGSAEIFPKASEITALQSARFFLSPKTGSNFNFVDPTKVVWSVLGGIGSVSSDGSFTPSGQGTGSVRASVTDTTLQASSGVTVTAATSGRSKWTVLVYMNAANDLNSFSTGDINEMEAGITGTDVRTVVQWKQSQTAFPGSTFDGVRRYLIKPDTTPTVASELLQSGLTQPGGGALDMGDPQTLADFIAWGKQNFPADRYALVIWNHGNGWQRRPDQRPDGRAFSYDDEYNSAIQTWQLDAALGSNTFDILAWDASLMQMVEVAYEVGNKAKFVVGSEESPPAEGYPYTPIMQAFAAAPDNTTEQLTRAFVDAMINHTPYSSRKITQSVVDTAKLPAAVTAINAYAQQLITHKDTIASAVQNARDSAQAYNPTGTRTFRDIVDLALIIEADASAPTSLKTASQAMRQAVGLAIPWEASNANSENSFGLSVDFSGKDAFASIRADYIQLKFARDTQWDEWLAVAP